MKKITILSIFLILIFVLVACSSDTADLSSEIDIAKPASASSETSETTVTNQQPTIATTVPVNVEFKDEDLETTGCEEARMTDGQRLDLRSEEPGHAIELRSADGGHRRCARSCGGDCSPMTQGFSSMTAALSSWMTNVVRR